MPSISTVPAPSPPKHSAAQASVPVIPGPIAEVSPEEQLQLREKARDMFYHAYDSYMQNAYPEVSHRNISPSLSYNLSVMGLILGGTMSIELHRREI